LHINRAAGIQSGMKQVPTKTLLKVGRLLLAGKRSPEIRRATGVSRWTVTLTAARMGVRIPAGRPPKPVALADGGRA